MNAYTLLLIAGFLAFAFCAQEIAATFKTYQEMRERLGELYLQQKYSEAAELLLWAREEFPDYLFNNTYNLVLMYARMDRYDKAIEALQYALDRGLWFAPYFYENEVWKPLKKQTGFNRIQEQSEMLKLKAQKTAKQELLVLTPDKFDPDKTYPLFIALHGGSENIEIFKDRWKSQKMSKEFITAYVQSSQVISWNGYWWHGDVELTKREIADAYKKIGDEYPVNKDSVIIGGFSSGGLAALEVVLSNTVPVAGFIVLCPDRPASFNAENVREAKERGTRGVLITGEQDERHPMHDEMVKIFEKEGLPHQYIVIPDIPHTYPEGLDEKIDAAIDHVRKASIIEE
ncbi:MAG: hypothetical protein JSV53_11180 [candidate division WOR-3 bacterium]|nr:MAG: hypothetical protein JSV53_11180 [candidate division WOR-3 bacterium]